MNRYNYSCPFIFLLQLSICLFIADSANAQCNINICGLNTIFSAGGVNFNATDKSIEIDNVSFGNIACSDANAQIGMDIYIYQLLPNGERIENCNVLHPFPNNILGYVNYDFGKDPLCGRDFNFGTIVIGNEDGFYPCDGALYEIEMALYTTTNNSFLNSTLTAYDQLSNTEYTMLNLGTVEVNINNVFPGNGQPHIFNEISDWYSRSSDTIFANCFQNVELFLQGQSLLSNCFPYSDYTSAIPSETSNILAYSVNDAAPIWLHDSQAVHSGGQITGLQSNKCYGGMLTSVTPYIFDAALLTNACDGTTVKVILYTNDGFTNQIEITEQVIVYRELCAIDITINDEVIDSQIYSAASTITSNGIVETNGNVALKAGDRIRLNSNFSVKTGGVFNASIGSCQ